MTGTQRVRGHVPLPELPGVTHRFLDLPGLRMHVAEAGQGDPVVLLHGFPQHWWEWRHVLPPLAGGYRVICPDLRGAGWSDVPAGGYTRDRLVADVVALLDALGLERVHLLTHDWGALVGFQLCLLRPDRVRTHLPLAVPHPYARLRRGLLASSRHAWYQLVIVTPGLGPRALSGGHQRFPRYLFRHFSAESAGTGVWSEQDLELFLDPLRVPARARAGTALYRHFIQPEALRILCGAYRGTRLATPTRLLVGAGDPLLTPEVLTGHQGHADDLGVQVVQRAAHWLPEERPDAVVEAARELFRRTGAGDDR